MLPQLVNLPRARELMRRAGVDGLVAAQPAHVYYLSGYSGFLAGTPGFEATALAVLPRHEDAPASLVLPALELRRLGVQGGSWMANLEAYSLPDPAAPPGVGVPYEGWPVFPGAALTAREQGWIDILRRHGRDVSADALHGLGRAIRVAGLASSVLATDDPRVVAWLSERVSGAIEVRFDPGLFNEIRKIKTEPEIEIMRQAALLNQQALLSACQTLREGASWSEIEAHYMTVMARQGGRGVYVICGLGGLPAGVIRRGEPIMLDALGQLRHYHGDFGRSAVLGEPSALHRHRLGALQQGWAAVREILRPGTRYSEIESAALAAIRGAGFPEFRYVTPHALGLAHTDDPLPPGTTPGARPDVRLEAGMVINVDMPYTEIGWGSVHLEDTVLVTADGHELLTTAPTDLCCVAA